MLECQSPSQPPSLLYLLPHLELGVPPDVKGVSHLCPREKKVHTEYKQTASSSE